MNKQSEHEIDGMEQLRKDIPPRRDLWPDIEARLGTQACVAADPVSPGAVRGRWGAGAVAAAVALAFVVGLFTGREVAVPETPVQTAFNGQQAAAPALTAALQAAELEYAAAYKTLMPLKLSSMMLNDSHRQGIEDSWAMMTRTELALKAALAEHPDSQFLGARLLSLRAQQLELMRQLHRLENDRWQISWHPTRQNTRQDTWRTS